MTRHTTSQWARLRAVGTLDQADAALAARVSERTGWGGQILVFVDGADVHAVRDTSIAFHVADAAAVVGVYTMRATMADIAADLSAWRTGQ